MLLQSCLPCCKTVVNGQVTVNIDTYKVINIIGLAACITVWERIMGDVIYFVFVDEL